MWYNNDIKIIIGGKRYVMSAAMQRRFFWMLKKN